MIDTPLPITYPQLLAKHEHIRIPRLQRDYAQGRKGAKETEVRNAFLEVLLKALQPRADGTFAPLNLDFVYGSGETLPDKHFSLLDGQQRLTTLFLLHWLLAWRDDCWDHFTEHFCEAGESRFAYRVRTTSNDFFNVFVRHHPPQPADELADLKGWITDQRWYFRYWRLDPTVQAILEMLQAMHELFKGHPAGLYARLTSVEHPAITFQLLDLGAFPLSDDLYIKMNARGKPLTAFETFKARYEPKLPAHFLGAAPRPIGGQPFPMPEFVAHRLDTAWTDFFWTHHQSAGQPDPQRLDESFMNVFRMVAIASRNPSSDRFTGDIGLLRDGKTPPIWSTFEARDWLDPEFSALLVSLLESWCAGAPLPPAEIFPQLIDLPAQLTVPQVVVFCGYALFLREHEDQLEPAQLAEWMRLVHNLSINSDISENKLILQAATGLRELLPHSSAILQHLAGFAEDQRVTGFSLQQRREETLKASLLLADPAGWRTLLERAEHHAYFRGQIGFLLEFSGTSAEWVKSGPCAWDAASHLRLQQSFLGYLQKAEAMFDERGLIDAGHARWQRALLSMGDYLLPNGWSNQSFLVNDASKPFSWKRFLRDSGPKRLLLKKLWDHPDYDQPSPANLDAIIAAATGLEPWQEALVRHPAAVLYCTRRNLQRDGGYVVLLSGERRSAEHAELFTFLLHRSLQPPAPFTLGAYFYRDAPHIPLHFIWGEIKLSLDIYGRDGDFSLWIEQPLPPDLVALLARAAFSPSAEFPTWLVRAVPYAEIEVALHEVAALLTTP